MTYIVANEGDYIKMSAHQWEDITQRLRKLDTLEAWGVDNWEGYDNAMQGFYGDDDD